MVWWDILPRKTRERFSPKQSETQTQSSIFTKKNCITSIRSGDMYKGGNPYGELFTSISISATYPTPGSQISKGFRNLSQFWECMYVPTPYMLPFYEDVHTYNVWNMRFANDIYSLAEELGHPEPNLINKKNNERRLLSSKLHSSSIGRYSILIPSQLLITMKQILNRRDRELQ
jgi:hypothetical protein